MRALVTGATGFVGGHLVEALLRHGAEVTALVRSPGKAAPLAERGVRLVPGSLSAERALAEAAEGQQVVFHVAALTAARSEAEFLAANHAGTAAVAGAAAAAGVTRLVHVSSLAAVGPSRPGVPLQGGEPHRPVTAYGRSKAAAEQVVMQSGLAWTIVRPPMVYGPGDRELLRVFRLAARGVAPVLGDGTQELSAVFAPDLAQALVAVALTEATVGAAYAACHPATFTQLELARAVGRAAGRPGLLVPRVPGLLARPALGVAGWLVGLAGRTTLLTADKANEFLAPAWTANPAPLARDTGWEAEHDLAEGLEATARWYRGHGWL